MDPLLSLKLVSGVLSADLFSGSLRRLVSGKQSQEHFARFSASLSELIGTSLQALELAELAERASVELGLLAENQPEGHSLPPELAIRLRSSLETLVTRDLAQKVSLVTTSAGSENDVIAGVSVQPIFDRFESVKREVSIVLNSATHSLQLSSRESTRAATSLTEMAYLSRTLVKVILQGIEKILSQVSHAAGR